MAAPRSVSALADLTIADVIAVARDKNQIKPLGASTSPPERERLRRIEQSAAWVKSAMREVETAAQHGSTALAYYGINTGFGDNAGKATFKEVEEAERLSRKLLLSHAIGVGDHLPEDAVRAALLIRITSLARGYSGVRAEVIDTLIA